MKVRGTNYLTVAELLDQLKTIQTAHPHAVQLRIALYPDGSGHLMDCSADYSDYWEILLAWPTLEHMERKLVLYEAKLEGE